MPKPASPQATYTYRRGRKLNLTKRGDEFVVRRLPGELPSAMRAVEQTSSASSRVTCDPALLEDRMREARLLAPTHHAYELADTGEEFLITDRILVSFKSPPSVDALGAFTARYALLVVERYSPSDFLMRLTDHTGMNPVKLVVKLTEEEAATLKSVDHDLNVRAVRCAVSLPTDQNYAAQWHLHRRTQPAPDYDPRASSRCEEAWQLLDGFGLADVVIGVTDDGCQIDHPDFDSAGKFAGWAYFEGTSLRRMGDPGAAPSRMYQPGADHGTACAGVIAAEIDGTMTVGAAPACRLLPVKWESAGSSLFISDSKILAALNHLADRVDIISSSWGITPQATYSQVVEERIRVLASTGGRRGRGILFLWAAGNENCPIQHTAAAPVPYSHGWGSSGTWVGVDTATNFRNDLVGIPGVMFVAALASTARRSHYSNYGTGIDICAPSSNSHAYWRLDLPGRDITTTRGLSAVDPEFGGTSSATPLVAGVAALVISAHPEITALELVSVLRQTASRDLNMTAWPKTPPASYDPNTAWDVSPVAPFVSGAFTNINSPDGTWSPWFGYGRVDAVEAVRLAMHRAGRSTAQVTVSSEAAVAIPDNQSAGIASRLTVDRDGFVLAARVAVDIEHPYIGDLDVRLVAPDGRRATLHRRAGASADNIVAVFDEVLATELSTMKGAATRGTWTLEVADLAPQDTGRLRKWRLELDLTAGAATRFESSPGATIPDNNPTGVSDTIAVAPAIIAQAISVDLDITHPYIGDLRVELTSPGGMKAILVDRLGGNGDNILRTFTPLDAPGLAQYQGQSAGGNWTLKVSDVAGADVGKLNRWALLVR